MIVKPSQFDLLAKLLDVAGLRHTVIAQNVANVNTPGYHRRDISFEEAFVRQLGSRRETEALKVTPKTTEPEGGPERVDGNNVDIDAELGDINKNVMLYNAYVQILANKIAVMRSAITGR
jgi:flagellar basal-body rod protein FlgB